MTFVYTRLTKDMKPSNIHLETLQALWDYWMKYGYGPSVRDLAKILHVGNSTTFYRIQMLKDYGWAISTSDKARTLRLTALGARVRDSVASLEEQQSSQKRKVRYG